MEFEKLTARDGLAFVLLKDFIKDGFPSPDARNQVVLAYMYADAILEFKEFESRVKDKLVCEKCGNDLKRVDAHSGDNQTAHIMICEKCKTQKLYGS